MHQLRPCQRFLMCQHQQQPNTTPLVIQDRLHPAATLCLLVILLDLQCQLLATTSAVDNDCVDRPSMSQACARSDLRLSIFRIHRPSTAHWCIQESAMSQQQTHCEPHLRNRQQSLDLYRVPLPRFEPRGARAEYALHPEAHLGRIHLVRAHPRSTRSLKQFVAEQRQYQFR